MPYAETVLEVQEDCTDQEVRASLLFVAAGS